MKVEFINYPYVFTDEGTRHHVEEINGTPRVGSEIDKNMTVQSNTMNSDCVNGVCPIR